MGASPLFFGVTNPAVKTSHTQFILLADQDKKLEIWIHIS